MTGDEKLLSESKPLKAGIVIVANGDRLTAASIEHENAQTQVHHRVSARPSHGDPEMWIFLRL